MALRREQLRNRYSYSSTHHAYTPSHPAKVSFPPHMSFSGEWSLQDVDCKIRFRLEEAFEDLHLWLHLLTTAYLITRYSALQKWNTTHECTVLSDRHVS
ncbi:hypothetical protein J6590_017357 [Homalodisca vitripennis]|nr:hypothetical protein J6590_017357 [Homalodisca vitripennis]